MKTTVLIMAGGRGERFWPRSRTDLPKQFLSLTGDGKTMIQLTIERILPLTSQEDIYIATNEKYRDLVRKQLPWLPDENILCEPVGKNTAPCIGFAAVHMQKKYGDAVMLVLPSDHDIHQTDEFRIVLRKVCEIAEEGPNLVTIGMRPKYPETGYGYIKYLSDSRIGDAYTVERFVEKPVLEVAKGYLASGNYLWNSGMFGWKISTILDNTEKYMPQNHIHLLKIQEAIGSSEEKQVLESEFAAMESQSIDFGIMEKAEHIYVVPGTFDWDDVGSWLALERLQQPDQEGNIANGDIVNVGSKGCIVQGYNKTIAIVGLENIVVVDTEDAILICEKQKTGDVKKVIEELRRNHRDELL